jgi:hypothetical protein
MLEALPRPSGIASAQEDVETPPAGAWQTTSVILLNT